MIDNVQTGLSTLQAVPIVGPVVFSPVKMVVSIAQFIGGFAISIICGIGSIVADSVGARTLRNSLDTDCVHSLQYSLKGIRSLFYACANLATLGILGGYIEMANRDFQFIRHSRDDVPIMMCGW